MKEDPNNYNHEGKFYYKLLDDVQALKDEKLALQSTLRNKHGIYDMQNEDILTQWRLRRDFRAYAVVILTLLFEFLFEICMGFNSKYDFILYLCLAQQAGHATTILPKALEQPNTNTSTSSIHQLPYSNLPIYPDSPPTKRRAD